jgi:hypothetical protein
MERRKQQGAADASTVPRPPKSRAAPAAAPSPRDQRAARAAGGTSGGLPPPMADGRKDKRISVTQQLMMESI